MDVSRHVLRSLGLGSPCFESRSRHCSNVGKRHRCCKYVIVFRKIDYLYVVLSIWILWPFLNLPLVTVELNHCNPKTWASYSAVMKVLRLILVLRPIFCTLRLDVVQVVSIAVPRGYGLGLVFLNWSWHRTFFDTDLIVLNFAIALERLFFIFLIQMLNFDLNINKDNSRKCYFLFLSLYLSF